MPEEGFYEVKYKSKRANEVRLLPNGFQERKLKRLANASAGFFNEINYERRKRFFHGEKVVLRKRGTNAARSTRVFSALNHKR